MGSKWVVADRIGRRGVVKWVRKERKRKGKGSNREGKGSKREGKG